MCCGLGIKKFLFVGICIGGLFYLVGCNEDKRTVKGSDLLASELRELDNFTQIEAGSAFQIVVTVGKEPAVEITGDDNIIGLVETIVDDDKLMIQFERGVRVKTVQPLKITVRTKKLERIELSGAAVAKVDDVKSDKFTADCSGASKLAVAGETKSLTINLTGASKAHAGNLMAEEVDLDANGASQLFVHASRSIHGDLSGASRLEYDGDAEEVKVSTSGASRYVKRSGDTEKKLPKGVRSIKRTNEKK